MNDLEIKINKKLELRLLQLDNAEDLFALTDRNRVNLRVWLGWVDKTKNAKDSKKFIQLVNAAFTRGEQIHFGIWFNKELVGVVSFHKIDKAQKFGEIGYWLGEDFQGKGIMTAAVKALVNYGFNQLSLDKLSISIAAENTKSLAVPEKLGFTHQESLKDKVCLYCNFRDHEVYSMQRKEWEKSLLNL